MMEKEKNGVFLSSVLYAEAVADVNLKVDEELKSIDPVGAEEIIQEHTIENTKGV